MTLKNPKKLKKVLKAEVLLKKEKKKLFRIYVINF